MRLSSTSLKTLFFSSLTTIAACASSGSKTPPKGTQPGTPSTTLGVGRYTLKSQFDLTAGLPDGPNNALNIFVEMTDDADDPAGGVIDLVLRGMEEGYTKELVRAARPRVVDEINSRLSTIAPRFYDAILSFGDDFGQIVSNFGTVSELNVTQQSDKLVATHKYTGVEVSIDGDKTDIDFASYQVPLPTASQIKVTFDAGKRMILNAHAASLPMGKGLRLMVDEVLVGRAVDDARTLGEMFQGLIDCAELGDSLASSVGGFDGYTYADICSIGLDAAAVAIYVEIEKMNADKVTFNLSGSAYGRDTNNDKIIDKITDGKWQGAINFDDLPSTISGAVFAGERK